MSIERARLAFTCGLMDRGWAADDAVIAVFATYPFDDGVQVERSFQKAIYRRRRANTWRVCRAGDDNSAALALERECLEDFLDIAEAYGETYYVKRFAERLGHESTPISDHAGDILDLRTTRRSGLVSVSMMSFAALVTRAALMRGSDT